MSIVSRCVIVCLGMVLVTAASAGSLLGCSATRQWTGTPRSAVEQLLVSQSLERSLAEATVRLAPGEAATVRAVGLTGDVEAVGSAGDTEFARNIVVSWLRQRGLHVRGSDAPYAVRVIIRALGTEQRESFFGVPPIASTLIPVSLPELAVYKAVRQQGLVHLQLEISDGDAGSLIELTPVYEGEAYFNQYTVLFWFTFRQTDLVPPPPESTF